MKSKSVNAHIALATLATTFLVSQSAQATLYTTSFNASEGYTSGDLNGQDGWLAQTQWQADGTGSISNTSGAFIRAQNSNVLGTTDIGEVMRITSTFSLSSFMSPDESQMAGFEEGIFQLGMSNQQTNQAPSLGLAVGLFYEQSGAAGNDGTLQLRANEGNEQSGTTSANLGLASTLGSTTWLLDVTFTKTGNDLWSIDASIDNLGDADPATAISYTASGHVNASQGLNAGDLDTDADGGGIAGVIMALPSSVGTGGLPMPPFGATTVSDFSIEVTAVPEPSAPAMLGLVCVAVGLFYGVKKVRSKPDQALAS